MFDKVMSWLESDAEGQEDVQTAVAALYYHMIVVDGQMVRIEVDQFAHLLKTRFDLDDDQLEALSVKGIEASNMSPGLFPFTVILNRDLDRDQQGQVLEALRQLADADGNRHELETRMIDDIAELLDG